MTQEKLLSVSDIARELNTGRATIKFLLKRFKKWIPCELIDGQAFYSAGTIKTVWMIQENIETGILPSDIEKKLTGRENSDRDNLLDAVKNPSQNGDIRLSNDGVTLLNSLFKDIGEQQRRIAAAHEKRARVEEIKAVAIEKRAEAEEKKADAMNNIAHALQEMNKLRAIDPDAHQIAYRTAAVIADDELDSEASDKQKLNMDKMDGESSGIQDAPEKADGLTDPDPEAHKEPEDDLSFLLDSDSILEEFDGLDDLSDEFDDEIYDTSIDPLKNGVADPQMDDLSKLIDGPLDISGPSGDPCDGPSGDPSRVSAESEPLDDLSALIDQEDDYQPAPGTDDPVKKEPEADLDDLSRLIDTSKDPGPAAGDLDDLSLLTGQQKSFEIKIEVSPEDDVKKYKAAIMKIIIELKADGLSVEETTRRLNENKIKTLSGKPEWTQKAISQIYTFIDSVK